MEIRKRVMYLTHPYMSVGKAAENYAESMIWENHIEGEHKDIFIMNPLRIVPQITKDDKVAMDYCYQLLQMCDAVILSGQWWLSKNCRQEAMWAVELDLDIYIYSNEHELIEASNIALNNPLLYDDLDDEALTLEEGVVNGVEALHKAINTHTYNIEPIQHDTLTEDALSELMEEQINDIPVVDGSKANENFTIHLEHDDKKPITVACTTINAPSELLIDTYRDGSTEIKIIPHDGSTVRILQLS